MTETTSKNITATIGGRSPIQHHGILGDKGETGVLYASMPMALARDNLLPATHSVASLIWSHTEGWEISVAAIAEARGMTRPTARKAVEELEARRWLVRQPYGQPGKKPAGEVWHIQQTNVPFTEAEVRGLSELVVITPGGKNLSTPGGKKLSTPGGNILSTKVVDVLEVDLQAVQSLASLDPQPVVVAEETAGDEEGSATLIEDSPDDDFEAEVRRIMATIPDTVPQSVREESARYKVATGRDYQRRVKDLPAWCTPEIQDEVLRKGLNIFDFVRYVESTAKSSSKANYARAILKDKPLAIAGGLWEGD